MHRTLSIMALAALIGGCVADRSTSPTEGALKTAPATAPSAADLPAFPPSGFVSEIDNPYLGFARGRTFTYEGETSDGAERIVVTVTQESKTILDVPTTVVHDQAYLDGALIEDTFDWFAQDEDGNVWYFGEKSYDVENGEIVDSTGSWEAGVDGAVPGLFMLAEPKVGVQYRQEFYEGVAEDEAKVVSLKRNVEVPFGEYEECLQTMEWTHLEPGARETKFYAFGIGMVLEMSRNGHDRVELTAIED
jgi:hypothetical protein